jgi:predicted MFS family arabinose efflux permease
MFRAMWLAVLVSNVGTWMQTVGAQWLLVHQPNAALLVALVQVADTLPDVAFGLIGGVLADTLDRRWLLIGTQAFLAATAIALTLLTIAGQMPPALLLTFTFVLGSGSVIAVPAYQSLIPELVPGPQIRSASVLSSLNINIARAVGPAIAGLLIARAGVAAVFAVNAASYVVYALVVIGWRPRGGRTQTLTEPFISALRAGGRYVRNAPVVRRLLIRAAVFLLPASALWALLPVVAAQRLQQGADGYGVLLAALGLGAIAGALILPRLRARWSINELTFIASAVYAAALVGVVLVPSAPLVVLLLLPAGVAWITVLSELNAALQLFLPGWVRARGLSVYQVVLFGSQGAGALVWGLLAGPAGLVATYLVAASALLAGAATIRIWPFADTSGMDRSLVTPWPAPQLVVDPEATEGPVVVTTTYTVSPEREQQFLDAMAKLRRSRLRTGATQWGLFREGETAHRFVELFVVHSWDEHVRQHRERQTGTDQAFEDEVNSLSDPPPETRHLLNAEVPDDPLG